MMNKEKFVDIKKAFETLKGLNISKDIILKRMIIGDLFLSAALKKLKKLGVLEEFYLDFSPEMKAEMEGIRQVITNKEELK